MLGIGVLLVLYLIGRRFGPSALASDYRSRFLVLWTLPPILTYLFSHLGEPGYVLSLAPQAAILGALGCLDLGNESSLLTGVVRARLRRWTPAPRAVGATVTGLLVVLIVGWNVQAFLRGVGPGRLPDLRAHDATTGAQVAFLQQQPTASTLVLAHDILRQVEFYLPTMPIDLLYSEYVPDFQHAHTRTDLPPGTTQVIVLDSPVQLPPPDAGRVHELVLSDSPRVSVWVVDVTGASAVEHGYQYLHVVP
jgi:hypothetical protein